MSPVRRLTCAHKSKVAVTKLAGCGFELLSYLLYSPDLALSDYHLFPHMKKHLCTCAFKDDKETKDDALDVLKRFSPTFRVGSIAALVSTSMSVWLQTVTTLKNKQIAFFTSVLFIISLVGLQTF